MLSKSQKRKNVRLRIRTKLSGTPSRPRLSVFKSNKSIYCQLIDDVNGVTLAAASLKETAEGSNMVERSKAVGALIAKKAIDNKIESVVFDRSGYIYHGRVKNLADAARDGGLIF